MATSQQRIGGWARTSDAAQSLLEAYGCAAGGATVSAPLEKAGLRRPPLFPEHLKSLPPPMQKLANAFSPHLEQHAAVAAGIARHPQTVRGASSSGASSVAASVLDGSWVPPLPSQASRCVAKSTLRADRDAQALSAISRAGLESIGAARKPHSARGASEVHPRVDRFCCSSASAHCGDIGDSCLDWEKLGSSLSHATTPSWRSRSFPPHLGTDVHGRTASDAGSCVRRGAQGSADGRDVRRGLRPPLPDEARGVQPKDQVGPLSEAEFLKNIDPAVEEGNALLVQSFLNVKRREFSQSSVAETCESATAVSFAPDSSWSSCIKSGVA